MTDRTEQSGTSPEVTAADYQEIPAARTPEQRLDERFTHGLIYDVVKVLEAHGYQLPPVVDGDETAHNRALGQSVTAMLELCRIFEGRDL